MSYPKPIVEMIQDVVTATSAVVLPTLTAEDANITFLNYMYGHPVEVMNVLAEMERSEEYRAKKFPCIILFQDFTESMGTVGPHYTRATLNIAIAHATRPDIIASERYTSSFKPILYPIYEAFIKQIALYNRFEVRYRDVRNVEHQKIDRLFWGKNGTNTGNQGIDYLDAIEIQNLTITIKNQTC